MRCPIHQLDVMRTQSQLHVILVVARQVVVRHLLELRQPFAHRHSYKLEGVHFRVLRFAADEVDLVEH